MEMTQRQLSVGQVKSNFNTDPKSSEYWYDPSRFIGHLVIVSHCLRSYVYDGLSEQQWLCL